MASTSSEPKRRQYTGSCHCGLIRYILYLTLPPPPSCLAPNKPEVGAQRIYKCNCSSCMKTGFFHARPADSPSSFVVLSPLDEGKVGEERKGGNGEYEATEAEGAMGKGAVGLKMGQGGLSDYTCFEKAIHWYFCSICGVRCFDFSGDSEVVTTSISAKESNEADNSKKVLVWKPKTEGWKENQTGYLSINACTLDQDQPGLDLREWHEQGWISYLDCKAEKGEDRFREPYEGGMY